MSVLGRFSVVTVLLVSVACAGTLNVQGPGNIRKPTVRLISSPRTLLLSPGEMRRVWLHISINNVNEEFWCPDIEWTWPNGTVSKETVDCDPYDSRNPDHKSWSVSKEMPVGSDGSDGEQVIGVELLKAGRRLQRLSVSVHVMGG